MVTLCVVIIWTLPGVQRTAWRRELQDQHFLSACIVFQTTALIRPHSEGKNEKN